MLAVFGGDPKRLKLMGGDYIRRSSRRVKVRGEREFIVNSDMMLRDFKVKVKRYKPFQCFNNCIHDTADGGVQGGPLRPEPDGER